LTKKHNIEAYRDPSQWGNDSIQNYLNSPYKQIIQLTREKKKKSILSKIKNFVKHSAPQKLSSQLPDQEDIDLHL